MATNGSWICNLRPTAARWFQAGLNLLLPPRCLLCHADLDPGAEGLLLCEACQERLAVKSWNGCPRCGALLPSTENARCSLCHGMALRFDATTALGRYEGELRDVIFRMKRDSGQPLAEALSRLLLHNRREQITQWGCDLVVPIPMFWTRRLVRRTNNPDTLADLIAKTLQIRAEHQILYRCRNTKLQRELQPRERFRNVAGAFAVRQGCQLDGQKVLLVDDVMTTGATASEAARVLKKAGAAQVMVAVIARAQGS